MKKSLVYLITVAIVASFFAGCGAKSEGLDPTAGEKTEQKADTTVPEKTAETAAPTEEKVETEAVAEEAATDDAAAKNIQSTSVYFDFDKYDIRDDMKGVVENVSMLIKEQKSQAAIKVEGNCDEWGTDEYNYALGLKRAKSVKDTLVGYGVNGDTLKLISYGESNPVCNEKTKECWQKNRRVEFKIAQ